MSLRCFYNPTPNFLPKALVASAKKSCAAVRRSVMVFGLRSYVRVKAALSAVVCLIVTLALDQVL